MSRLCVLALVACMPAHGGSGSDATTKPDSKTTIDGNGCSVQPCSILPACGCNSSQTCDADAITGAGTTCRSINAPGHETATCQTALDCDRGYTCAASSCHEYCTSSVDCAAPRGQCVLDLSFNGQLVPNVPALCSSGCDPTLTTQPPECPASWKCSIFFGTHNGSPSPYTDCWPTGSGTQGASCKDGTSLSESLCARGYLCTSLDGGTTDKCRKICTNPGATSSTQCGGQKCNSFTPAFVLAGVSYGYCSP